MSLPLDVARRLGANGLRLARRGWGRLVLPPRGRFWLRLRLAPPLEDVRLPALPFAREPGLGLLELLEVLEAAGRDPQVQGVLLQLEGAPHGWAKVLTLRRAVERLRATGKPVAAYGEVLGAGDLLIGSAAGRLWMPEAGSLLLLGLRAEGFFLRDLLTRLHVAPDVVRIGTHKTGAEMFTRESMSPEQREQLEALLDDLYRELVERIAAGRELEPAALRDRIDRGPYGGRAALEAGLVDACLYPDEVGAALDALAPGAERAGRGEEEPRVVEAGAYHALRVSDAGWRPLLHDVPRIAYIVASGLIRRGQGLRGIASDALRSLLEAARRDEDVRGVVLRIESPGGDGLASDLLWRAVRRTTRDKPVVVSMGDYATSGGYYVAAAADAVFAEAATVTGSIGVVGGKLDLSGLYQRLGVGRDAVERGARAGLMSEARGFTSEERAALRAEMTTLYDTFVRRVAEGRGLEPEEVERVAQGRVWSGARARGLGLVDALGGPLEALAEARRRAGLREGERALLEVQPRLSRLSGLRALLTLLGAPRSE